MIDMNEMQYMLSREIDRYIEKYEQTQIDRKLVEETDLKARS